MSFAAILPALGSVLGSLTGGSSTPPPPPPPPEKDKITPILILSIIVFVVFVIFALSVAKRN